MDLLGELQKLGGLRVEGSAPLAPFTTFRIGGPADVLVVPESVAALSAAAAWVRRRGLPLLVLGAGSNLVIADSGFRGVAIKIPSGLSAVRHAGDLLIADAGRTLPELMRRARSIGLSGLEFAGGIPGSLGGSIAVNAGAWGREMAEVVAWVRGIDDRGEPVEWARDAIDWSYRRARFPRALVVTEAALALNEADPAEIRRIEDNWHDARKRSQPLGEPSAGCVFKNTDCGTAGRLIDAAGLKGTQVGGAQVSPVHANFIVNRGEATAGDVAALIALVRRRVAECHGVRLELEIKLVGVECPELSTGDAPGGG